MQTASQTVGPFFHDALIHKGENQLINEQTAGFPILLHGQMLDGDGEPVPDGLVEIWQADAHGYFNHPADPNQAQADPYFAGFGRSDTVENGRFSFITIKPGIIPGHTTPFINIRLFARGMLTHAITRIYFGDEDNSQDDLLNTIPAARRPTLLAQPEASPGLPRYRFDIHLQGKQETVFFNP